MLHDQADSPSLNDGYTVHLTEQCDGWSIAVTRAGQAAAFEVHHRDAQCALGMAKAVAQAEGADLVVVTATQQGHEFVPAPRVASYVLPFHPAHADGCLRTSFADLPAVRHDLL